SAYAADRLTALFFTGSIFFIAFYNFINYGSKLSHAILVCLVLFIATTLLAAFKLAKNLRENIVLRFEEQKSKQAIDLLSQRQRFHFEHTPLAVIELDATHKITFWNNAASKIFGYSMQEVLGQNILLLVPQSQHSIFNLQISQLKSDIGGKHIHTTNITHTQEIIHCEWFNTILRDHSGNIVAIACLVQDETAYVTAKEEIERLAYFDALTHLPNRRLLNNRIQQALSKVARQKNYGCIIFIDIDNFKTLNDSQGHAAGDMLLFSIASRLQKILRSSDTAARLGGDEFVLLLENIGSTKEKAVADSTLVAQKVLEVLNQPFDLNSISFKTSASLGISFFSNNDYSPEELIKFADTAMYKAKQSGKNNYYIYTDNTKTEQTIRTQLRQDIKYALEKNQFTLNFQPQVDFKQHIFGIETLLRWTHPQLGNISPMDFIPVAEENKQIISIGHWVLLEACKQLYIWQQSAHSKHLKLSVNISAIQFQQTDFVAQVLSAITETQCDPSALTLELTESMIIEDFELITTKMYQLKALGLKLAMDNYGTSCSSISLLKHLPIDILKIDRSLIMTLPSDKNSEVIIKTIIAMGVDLYFEMIAEGVETDQQARLLLELGCQNIQGYLYSKPVDIQALNAMLMH
ncbi:MAG: EAL domain-containing protein, partial [Methylophilus sp.]